GRLGGTRPAVAALKARPPGTVLSRKRVTTPWDSRAGTAPWAVVVARAGAGTVPDGAASRGAVVSGKAVLQSADEERRRVARQEEEQPDHRQRLGVDERAAPELLRGREHLHDADREEVGRLLEHGDRVVAQA